MKPKLRLSQLILIIGTIIVFGSLLFFYDDKKALSVVLTTFSGFAVIYAIIFEGELKKEKDGRSKLTLIGFFLIVLYVAVSFGNGYNARNTIAENEQQSQRDSISTEQIISDLKDANRKLEIQRKQDSTNIIELNARITRLDTTLILNAIKELEEQRRVAEQQKENTFYHLKTEIIYNLRLIYDRFSNSELNEFRTSNDSTFFITTGFHNDYISQYKTMSGNQLYINNLSHIENYILELDHLYNSVRNSKGSKRVNNIESLKKGVALLHNSLYPVLCSIYNLESYKQFESLDKGDKVKNLTTIDLQTILDYQLSEEYLLFYGNRMAELLGKGILID